ncbi:MAG: response regulator [Sandaracinaceae bacterium]
MAPARLLLVDDNLVDRERVLRLVGRDYTLQEVATAASALRCASLDGFDCILLDYRLPDADGLDTLEVLVERGLPVVMLTGQGDERTAVEAMKRGAHDYIAKASLDARTLRRSITNAMEKAELRRRVESQRAELEERLAQLAAQREELAAKNAVLREREAKLRVILHQLPAVAWTTDVKLRCTSIVGTTEHAEIDQRRALGKTVGEALRKADGVEDAIEAHRRALNGSSGSFELRWSGRILKGRAEPLWDASDTIVGVIGVVLDVTETRQLEEQFRHAQKMDALGQLAGGVAHDFNNLLTAIVGFTQFARSQLPGSGPVHDDLAEVLASAKRGAELVRKLLAFSSGRVEKPRPIDVNEMLTGLLPMLTRVVGENVSIGVELAPHVPATLTEPGGVEQVIVNLVVNARDAMPQGGSIGISTAVVTLDETQALAGRASIPPGEYVVLAVSDSGPGIPPDVRDRIFEPFYTTKQVGRGTGLGLSTCYGIARSAGGGIGLYSEVGLGTTFRVYFPSCAEVRILPGRAPVPEPSDNTGDEQVLVLEDDPQVRRAVIRALRAAGYDVLAATGLEDARLVAANHATRVELIVSDVVMPGATGPEAIEELRTLLPDAAVLYMTGYASVSLRGRALVAADVPVLEKPFTSIELTRAVRRALDARAALDPTHETQTR